jgi:hypothetical protein
LALSINDLLKKGFKTKFYFSEFLSDVDKRFSFNAFLIEVSE